MTAPHSTDTNTAVVLVTGPSGAGRSTAIHVFEDLGFETIDNIPLAFLPKLFEGEGIRRPMALGIDVRNRDFSVGGVIEIAEHIAQKENFEPTVLFLDCHTDVLLHRYSETRRRHPMAPEATPLHGIRLEKTLLQPLQERADVLIDTSQLTPHDLKAEIRGLFGSLDAANLAVSVQSFSYKRGMPRGIDMAMDCRFLSNPHWVPELRAKNGHDPEVLAHVKADPLYEAFFDHLMGLTTLLLPAYRDEGKAHFNIGLGCTGGQHRSVALTNELAKGLRDEGWMVSVRHRELERRKVV